MYFVFSPRRLPYYAAVAHRPLGISALADQQFAGALMWVPVLFIFGGAAVVCFVLWLREQDAMDSRPARRSRLTGVVLAAGGQRMHPVVEAVHPYNEQLIVERGK
jgi:cytochrome c oxidase assembly factor CtaG